MIQDLYLAGIYLWANSTILISAILTALHYD